MSGTTLAINDNTEMAFDFGEFSFRSIGMTITVPDIFLSRYKELVASVFSSTGDSAKVQQLKSIYNREKGRNEKFIISAYSSIIEHERRHFHDYIATPFGASIMEDLMLACRYLPIVINQLLAEETIALPLQAWQNLTPALYSIYKKKFSASAFKERPPETLNRLIESATNILNRVQKHFSETQHILEASALAVQVEKVEYLFGYEASVAFASQVHERDVSDTYSKMWSLFNTITDKINPGSFFTPLVANAIILYGLCGTNEKEAEMSSPVDRINAVLGYLLHSKEITTDENIWDILNYCSTIFKIPNIEESFSRSVADSKQFLQTMRKLGEQDSALLKVNVANKDLYDCYESWISGHEFMAANILKDIAGYCEPVKYLNNQANWVATPMYVAITLDNEKVLQKKFKEAGWDTVWGLGDRTVNDIDIVQTKLMQLNKFQEGEQILSMEKSKLLSQHIWMLYLLLSKGMLNPTHRNVGSAVLNMFNPKWNILLL